MEINFVFSFLFLSTLLAAFILLSFRETRKVGLGILGFFALIFILGLFGWSFSNMSSQTVITQAGDTIPLPPAYQVMDKGSSQPLGVPTPTWFKLALLTIFGATAIGVILFVLSLWSNPKTRPYGNAVFFAGLLFIVLLFIGLSPILQVPQALPKYQDAKWDAVTTVKQNKSYAVNPDMAEAMDQVVNNLNAIGSSQVAAFQQQPTPSNFRLSSRQVQDILLPLPPPVVPDISSPDAIQKRITALETAINGLTRMLGRLTAEKVKENSEETPKIVENKSSDWSAGQNDVPKQTDPLKLKPLLPEPKTTPVQTASAVEPSVTTGLAEKPAEKIVAVEKPITSATADSQRPAWVGKPPFLRRADRAYPDYYVAAFIKPWEGDCYVLSVSTDPYATRQECEAKIPEVLQSAVNQYVELYLGNKWSGYIGLSAEQLRQFVVAEWEETKDYSVGTMTQVHLLLNFDRKAKDSISQAINQQLFTNRAAVGGTAFIGIWLLLAVIWGYLKADIAMKGTRRKLLRSAATVAILTILIVGWLVLGTLA